MANTTAIRRQIRESFNEFAYTSYPAGNVWYVSSVSGASGNVGTSPDYPMLDIATAHTAASAGDTIVLMRDHAETVTSLSITKASIRIIGTGIGTHMPQLTFAATDAQMVVSGANFYIEGVRFTVGIDAVVAAMSVTGVGFWMNKCIWDINNGTMGMVLGILTAATATEFKVTNSRFLGPATNSGTTVTACIKHEVGEDFEISDCYFTGKMTQAILNATALLRGLITRNNFVIATGTKAIAMHASSTPFITNNRINVSSGTAPIVCAAGFMAGNVYSAAAGVTAGTASTF